MSLSLSWHNWDNLKQYQAIVDKISKTLMTEWLFKMDPRDAAHLKTANNIEPESWAIFMYILFSSGRFKVWVNKIICISKWKDVDGVNRNYLDSWSPCDWVMPWSDKAHLIEYESFSDVGESPVWFASKNLKPCRMHWNAFLIAQIIAKCHSFPNKYGMLWRKSTVWPGKLISSKKNT